MLNNYYPRNFKFIVLQKRFFPVAIVAIFSLCFIYSCTKLDTTLLGEDLVTVDNVNTFADTLEVSTSQGIFTGMPGLNDSTLQLKTDNQILGNITEPNFGGTEASIYVQFKPTFYPYYFGNAGDTVKNSINARLDSVFLCLSPSSIWGDSTSSSAPQNLEVFAVTDNLFRDKPDSLFGLKYEPAVTGNSLGSIALTPQILKNKYFYGRASSRDSVTNQIRIKLDTAAAGLFLSKLYLQDSSITASNNGFSNDSVFRRKYNGFRIKSTSVGGALYAVNLANVKTRLEFHYHKVSSNGLVKDTVVSGFNMEPNGNTFTGVKSPSSVTNRIKRIYAGSPLVTAIGPTTTNAYLQNAPGTFINVSVPKLTGMRNSMNKVVHRAYLQIDQNDAPNPTKFTAPPYLYLDLKDSIIANRYKPLYFDLNSSLNYNPDATFVSPLYHPYPSNNINQSEFGGRALTRVDGGVSFTRYEINVTRYVQHIIANNYYNYDMRVFAPYNYSYNQYLGSQYIIPFYNPLATGSVRVGAGVLATPTSPDPSAAILATLPRRMKLIIIYSTVK